MEIRGEQVNYSSPYTPSSHGGQGQQRGRQRWHSWLVPTLVAVNVVVFAATMYVNDCLERLGPTGCIGGRLGRLAFQPLSENPLFGPSSSTLEKMGSLNSKKVIGDHQGWRLISCIWLHAGVIHLVANILSLLFIGIQLEQEFGFLKIGIIYLMSGFGGSLLSALFLQNRISVGALGAVFGLVGAMLSELIIRWSIYSGKWAALTTIISVLTFNLVLGILPHVDNFTHIGGFISGFLLGFIFLLQPRYGWKRGLDTDMPMRSKNTLQHDVLWALAIILLIAGYVVTATMVFRGVDGNKHCDWCHYLSCVSTSKWSCQNLGLDSCEYTRKPNDAIYVMCQTNHRARSFRRPNDLSNLGLMKLCTRVCN